MPQIEIREEQAERLAALEEALDAHAGPYASVTTVDAVEYLLDLAAEVGDQPGGDGGAVVETAASLAEQEGPTTDGARTDGAVSAGNDPGSEDDESGGPSSAESASGTTDAELEGSAPETASTATDSGSPEDGGDVFDLLREHDDKWRKSGGDEPYEVDLPDGDTEHVRTRGDVKAILFKNYR